ncbi:MAG TPA: methyltransferase domain-containing protein [Usitatibacteraceae bacterium]|nr:methyltransferase domain-containing protein [Usitatibacteraceae bacterium]
MTTNLLADWFGTPLGAYLLEKERAYLDDVTPDLFGFHALQLGLPQFDLLRENRITHRMRIDAGEGATVRARSHELPIATQSIDLALLPHVLEFAENPHEVLREIDRVMMPEGRIVILGFNPWSLWGLRSVLGPSRHETPWNGKFVSLLRAKDWLALLGYEVSAGRLICYVPPVRKEKLLRRLAFMEPAGDRWWAVGGAVYMLQAIKRVRGMRLLTPAWHEALAREKRVALAAKREGAGAAATSRAGSLRIVK